MKRSTDTALFLVFVALAYVAVFVVTYVFACSLKG